MWILTGVRKNPLPEQHFHGKYPRQRDRAAKEGSSHRAIGDGVRRGVEAAWGGADWDVSVSRGQEPSLVVSPKTNLWHCLGKCNVGGSTIDWVMKTKGVSFRHAVELLRADHPSLAAGEGRVVRKGTTAKLDAPVKAEADDQEALRQVMAYYHETLKESPEALRYLEARGLTHPEMLEQFQLGFANRTLGYRLPDRNRKEGAELRGRLQKLGILPESGHEHFMGSVVFPVPRLRGRVLGIYGRKINGNLRAGSRCIRTCRGRIAGCGTKRRWWRRKRSSCASRSSMR